MRLTWKYPVQKFPVPVTSPFLYGKRAAEKIIFQNQSWFLSCSLILLQPLKINYFTWFFIFFCIMLQVFKHLEKTFLWGCPWRGDEDENIKQHSLILAPNLTLTVATMQKHQQLKPEGGCTSAFLHLPSWGSVSPCLDSVWWWNILRWGFKLWIKFGWLLGGLQ